MSPVVEPTFTVPVRLEDVDHPTASTPILTAARIHNRESAVSVFGDDVWDLSALEEDPARASQAFFFSAWPPGFKEFGKHFAFALLNYGAPESLFETPNSNYVQWPSAPTINSALGSLRQHAVWLTGEWSEAHPSTPVLTPADLDPEHLNDLRRMVESLSAGSRSRTAKLEVIVKTWHLNPWLPEAMRWPTPDWRNDEWRIREIRGENRTERIPQATMGPLLEWAIAFVTAFADDIFQAETHYRSHLTRLANGEAPKADSTLLEEYVRQGKALPLNPSMIRHGAPAIAWSVVSYRHGVSVANLAVYYNRRNVAIATALDPRESKLDIRPTATFHGRLWIPAISVFDVHPAQGKGEPGPLLGHLRTACMIVCAYLTGARPEEVLGFQHGAARQPIERANGTRLHLIDGMVWKGVRRQADGSPGGARTATWTTLAVASSAVLVAERCGRALGRDSGPLFARPGQRAWTDAATGWIENFVRFVNARLVPHSANPAVLTIPHDDNALTLRRFRRTLAWFINNRPDGAVTTAIQYQHLSDTMAGGYAGTKESGMRDLLLEEDWAHRRRTIQKLGELLEDGQQLSGPGAERAMAAVEALPRFLTPADERRARRRKDLVVYDNAAAIVLCVYREATAQCETLRRSGIPAGPTLVNCVDGCLNCAWTEGQLARLTDDAASLRAQAEVAPKPLAQSLIAQAEKKERTVREAAPARAMQAPS